MNDKIINLPGMRKSTSSNGKKTYCDKNYAIDYASETGKLILEIFFEEERFYIIKKCNKSGLAPDILFQHYSEFDNFCSQLEDVALYENRKRLYFADKSKQDYLYEIRRVTNAGESYLAAKGYDSHQDIINTIWKEPSYTEAPDFLARTKKIRENMFEEHDDDTLYTNTAEVHDIIKSHAYKSDDGYYTISGKHRYYTGPVFVGNMGISVERSLRSLFDGKRLLIVKDCKRDRYMLIRDYPKLESLWEKTGYINVKDEAGDLVIYCTKDLDCYYKVRTVTEAGQTYLDHCQPYPKILDNLWNREIYVTKIYKR